MNTNNPMTPGVYTVEKSAFPPAIPEVPTAIPAFLGYTEFARKSGKPITEPLLINSMAEYQEHFGGPPPFKNPICKVQATDGKANEPYDFEINDSFYKIGEANPGNAFYLYFSLQLFYQNGGGPCYLASVGPYQSTIPNVSGGPPKRTPTVPHKKDFLAGLKLLSHLSDPKPTLILAPDSLLLDQESYYSLQEQILLQCGELRDRIGIIDVHQGYKSSSDTGVIDDFRNMIGNNYMSYGVSYYPFLQTTIVDASQVSYTNVDQDKINSRATPLSEIFPGEQALGRLASLTDDLVNVEQLTIPPPYDYRATPKTVPSTLEKDIEAYLDWNVAFNASPPPTPTDFATSLKWQLNVVYAMALTLKSLVENKTLPYPSVTITSQDLENGIGEMIKPSGYLASLLYGLAPFDSNFSSPPGVMTEGNLAKIFTTSTGSTPPAISTATPYPASATTAKQQYGIFHSKIKAAFSALMGSFSQVAALAKSLLSQYNAAFENSNQDYKNLMGGIADKASRLPPGPAMAGVMTLVDNSEGVWVSPANRNINSVTAPTVSINNDEQASLNVDPVAGKSINAIRSFLGRGAAIIWGGRTLDGNSLDWKYLNLRRTLIMIEQSVANTALQFAFEVNDASTWKTAEGMIANFLHNLWTSGALQGASPEDAYEVAVGLGETMTPVDLLEGILRIEVKVALVHPAEFIVISYEQNMAGRDQKN